MRLSRFDIIRQGVYNGSSGNFPEFLLKEAPAVDFFSGLSGIYLGKLSLSSILSALVILIVCYFIIRFANKALKKVLAKTRLEKGLCGFLSSALRILLWAVAVILVAGSLGIDTASLVALLSVAGLALSLAIQGVAANLFSGVTLLVTKPFVSGDYVSIGGMEGTVQSIGLFHTQMLTLDNRMVYIPNSEITGGKVLNFSHEPIRRVDLLITASYDDPVEGVKDALRELCAETPDVLSDPAPFAAVASYKDSCIEYTVRAWTKTSNYWPVYHAINDGALAALKKHGYDMSYNHVNVHIIDK